MGGQVYDGTTNANSSNFTTTFSNLASGENLNLTGSGTVASKKCYFGTINHTREALPLLMAMQLLSNYNLTTGTLNINKRPLGINGSRVYNFFSTASASDLTTVSNLVGSETISLSGMVLWKFKYGDSKLITNISGLSLGNGTNGGLAAQLFINRWNTNNECYKETNNNQWIEIL